MGPKIQKAADVWKKGVCDFQAFSQTFLELRFSLGNEGKDGKLPDILLPDIRDHPKNGYKHIFLPLDQSVAYIVGLFRKKSSIFRLRGTKMQKLHYFV